MGKKNLKTKKCMEIQYGLQTGNKTCTYKRLKYQKL